MVKCAKGTSGKPIGCAQSNPFFDTREYVVEFSDGSTENYFANVSAECIYAQVDSEGNQYQLLSETTDHRSDNSAIQIAGRFITGQNGNCVFQGQPPKVSASLVEGWIVGLVATERFKRCLHSPNCRVCSGKQNGQ